MQKCHRTTHSFNVSVNSHVCVLGPCLRFVSPHLKATGNRRHRSARAQLSCMCLHPACNFKKTPTPRPNPYSYTHTANTTLTRLRSNQEPSEHVSPVNSAHIGWEQHSPGLFALRRWNRREIKSKVRQEKHTREQHASSTVEGIPAFLCAFELNSCESLTPAMNSSAPQLRRSSTLSDGRLKGGGNGKERDECEESSSSFLDDHS